MSSFHIYSFIKSIDEEQKNIPIRAKRKPIHKSNIAEAITRLKRIELKGKRAEALRMIIPEKLTIIHNNHSRINTCYTTPKTKSLKKSIGLPMIKSYSNQILHVKETLTG